MVRTRLFAVLDVGEGRESQGDRIITGTRVTHNLPISQPFQLAENLPKQVSPVDDNQPSSVGSEEGKPSHEGYEDH